MDETLNVQWNSCAGRSRCGGASVKPFNLVNLLKKAPKSDCCGVRQACISADSGLAGAGQRLQALRELCDTLHPEEAHRLAQTQLRECQSRLVDFQRQFSGDQDAPLSDCR